MFKQLGAFCVILTCGLAQKYPSDLPKCQNGDVACIMSAIEHILPLTSNGVPALNIPALDPIKIKQIQMIQDDNGPVTIKILLTNVDIYGIDTFHIRKVVGFGKDIEKSKFEFYGDMPRLTFVGDYNMNGRILVLPIIGNGKINVTLEDSTSSMKLQPKVLEKNGKKYLQIKKINYKALPTNVKIHLTNLFGGDEQLGRTMNQFLNENWKEIYGEMRDVIESAIGKILIDLLNNIFSKIEYKELFINE